MSHWSQCTGSYGIYIDQYRFGLPLEDTHDIQRDSLSEVVSKCMVTRQEAQTKFDEYHDTQKSHVWDGI